MKAKYSKEEILFLLPNVDAVGFDKFCEDNNIEVSWLDVSLEDYNREYYNVELPAYGLEISYYNGVFEEVIEL